VGPLAILIKLPAMRFGLLTHPLVAFDSRTEAVLDPLDAMSGSTMTDRGDGAPGDRRQGEHAPALLRVRPRSAASDRNPRATQDRALVKSIAVRQRDGLAWSTQACLPFARA
jgi:hypothetical protein